MKVDLSKLSDRTLERIRATVDQLVRNGGPRLTVQEMADHLLAAAQRDHDPRPPAAAALAKRGP